MIIDLKRDDMAPSKTPIKNQEVLVMLKRRLLIKLKKEKVATWNKMLQKIILEALLLKQANKSWNNTNKKMMKMKIIIA